MNGFSRDVLLRLGGGGAEMRRTHHVLHAEQPVVGRRLRLEHVDAGTRHPAAPQRGDQVGLHDQAAARAIDDAHPVLHARDRRRVDDVPGLFGERRVQRDDVGTAEKLVQFHLLDAELRGALLREERIVAQHMHLQADGARRDDRADIAAADDAERLAGDLDPHEAVLLPLAGMGRRIGLRYLPGEREHHGDGVLGGRDRIAKRRVHHDDAATRRRGYVDIVDADAGASDDFQPGRGTDQLLRHLGGGAHREAVILIDDFQQLVLVLAEIRQVVDVDAVISKDLDGAGGEFV